MAKYPQDVHGQLMPFFLMREYPEMAKFGMCYIDLWPISWPMLATFHPDVAAQYTQENSMPKHEIIRSQFRPLTGLKDLVLAEGQFWKKWRSTFNPGFSTQNILALVPDFIEEAYAWRQYLEHIAETGDTVHLEDSVMRVTCDVIGRSVLGLSLGIQTGKDDRIFPALKKAISLLIGDWAPSQWGRLLNPFRIPRLWYYNWVLRNELRPLIERQLVNHTRTEGPKTINGLAIRTYIKDIGGARNTKTGIDSEFLDIVVENLKIFLFAGHDTTSSTPCFAFYHLHSRPDVLEKMRAEHDSVLGPDASDAGRRISENPALLNQLPYTTAVIKESLRLDPPIGSVREGSPNFFLRHPKTGQALPTEGFMLFAASKTIHHNPEYWPNPDDFIPERWLNTDVYKNAYRPFELGPRACIGQGLAMTEMRMLLAMTVRELEIIPAYDEKDPVVMARKAYQAYMPGELTAHPSKGMPATVRLRKHHALA
ncbi:sterigmatocystin biosynthesis [Fusarium albosuccineum]|uniref:Sterigmatocystin biosynthesis n=1 Tax=Fusarium albosuccineum TaxID=1237068 RepID=A0A8H4P7V0_9HYPO|nr:sterigmatocystin biosynthesis [Fusarium albosuccineum]